MKKNFLEASIVLTVTILLYATTVYEETTEDFSGKANYGCSIFLADKRDTKEKKQNSVETIESMEAACENAICGYNEFLANERSIAATTIEEIYTPTGEPDRRYVTYYLIHDIDGDGIPELHVQTCREYLVFSYKNGKFYMLKGFFSDPTDYYLTKDGILIYISTSTIERRDFWKCFKLDSKGNETDLDWFYRIEINENNYYDEDDIYVFNETECTMEEWIENTRKYLYTDENGWEHIRDEVEWMVFCEEVW